MAPARCSIFTNPKTDEWFRSRLSWLKSEYGVDGFKFDGGDSEYCRGLTGSKPLSPNDQTQLYGRIGLDFPLNEYRAMWKIGGEPLAERLSDKAHSWTDLQKLIPNMTLAGLMGYLFSCPDMIGGGEFTSFPPGASIDQDLIVRWAQCQALMPMMQFSVAPWRVLDREHLKAVIQAVRIREAHSAYPGTRPKSRGWREPIVRSMEYEFPHEGFIRVADQFMLGKRILVAPTIERIGRQRKVLLPSGRWRDSAGKVFGGPSTIEVSGALDALAYFERL